MVDTIETSIIGYSCPLCGKWHSEKYYFVGYTRDGIEWYHDKTPCCEVIVCWAKMDNMFVYVGSFRNEEKCRNWQRAAGGHSGMRAAGEQWDVEGQKWINDVDEIPF